MGAYSDAKQEYHKSRIRDIMILKPSTSVEGIQRALEQSSMDSLVLHRDYIRKLTKKIKKERIVKIDRSEIKERIASMRETFELVSEQMWRILLDGSADGKGRVAAGKVIVDSQKILLEAEMNAGIYDRKLGTLALENTGSVEHIHRLDPEMKAPIMRALENYGIIKRVTYTIVDPEPATDTPAIAGATLGSV